MARNRFDVDERLETPFNIKHLLRAGVYIKRHSLKMILSLIFSAICSNSPCTGVCPETRTVLLRCCKKCICAALCVK